MVLLDDLSSQQNDLQLHSIAHGVVLLEQLAIDYGAQRRRLRVVKMRGIEFKGGFHDFTIRQGGLRIYPRLVAAEHLTDFENELVSSGNAELDTLLGGGIERGTSALLIGAAGVGKSSLALTYAIAAAGRNERSVIFAFDEGRRTMAARAKTLGLPLSEYIDQGLIEVQQIDPAEMAPGEFSDSVRRAVEAGKGPVVIIDSLNGYLNAMPDERFLILQMHELLSYLGQRGRPDGPGPGTARSGWTDRNAARHQLPCRRRDHVAVFRVRRQRAARAVRGQEAKRQSRKHNPGVQAQPPRHHGRSAAQGLQRNLQRSAGL